MLKSTFSKVNLLFGLLFFSIILKSQTTDTYNCGTTMNWTVPPCVTSISVNINGAQGGGINGGLGASMSGTLTVTPGQVLTIVTGCQPSSTTGGYGGGGNGQMATGFGNESFGGGGASSISIAGTPVVVAAGGGGTGGGDTDAQAGDGGCPNGTAGTSPFGQGGFGATTTAGGSGGPPWITSGNSGSAGTLGQGGTGGSDPCYDLGPGGGGGGGYYGGGGGGSDCYDFSPLGGGGGGGGSSLVPAGFTCGGTNSGNGLVTITYTAGGATANASNAGPYCEGQTIQLNAGGGTTYSWSGPNGFTSSSQNPSLSGSTTAMSGVYTVTVSTAGCTATATATTTVTIDAAPVPTSSNTGPYCEGTTIDLSSGGGGSYSWSGPNGFTSTSQNPSITGSTTAMGGTYTVTVTVGTCTASSTTSVTINAAPVINANNTGPYCIGDAINLTSGGGATYSWAGPNAFSSASQNPTIPAATLAESGVYTVTVTSAASCTATATTSVTVNPPPAPSSSNSGPYCENGTISLSSSGGSAYSWSGPAGYTSTNQNPTITPATTAMDGVYTVTVSVGSCTATSTTTVVVNAAPVPAASNTGAYCAGDQIDLSSSGGTTYSWAGPNAYSSASQNPSIASSTTAEAGVYTVTVTDANNCSATATTSVTVNALPVPALSSNGPLCEGDSLAVICSNGTSWTWSGPNGFTSANDTVIFTPVTPTEAGTYSISITDANGCSDTASINVAVNALPVVTASAAAVCAGDTGTLNANGAVNYTWSAGTNPATGTTVDANPGATTTYTVTGVDANGCQDTGVVTLTVNALPLVTVTTASICPGMSDTLAAAGALNYTWSAGATPITTDQDSATVSPAVTTSYTVTGTDVNGCVDTAVTTVNVNNAGLTLTLTGNTVLCLGDSTTLNANGGTVYVWNPGAMSGPTVTVTPSATTDYTVNASDANGCTGTDTITVNVAPTMTTATTGTNITCNSACNGQASVNVTPGTGSFATYTYAWSNGATNASTAADLCPGTYTVTITDGAGCTTTDTVSVTEPPVLAASAASTDVLCNGASTGTGNVSVTGGTPAYTYAWSNSATGATQSNLAAGTYSVVIADANACLDTVQITITQPTALTATLTPTDISCVNPSGAITASASGGAPGYAYSWAPSGSGQNPSGLTAGTYTLTLTDTNNCVLTQTVAVTTNTVAPGANAGANAILNCGPNASLPLSGSSSASGATYSWSGPGGFTSSSANPSINTPGIYTLTTTNPANGCTSTDTVAITQSYIDASFTYSPGSGTWPLSVGFTNTSDNATMYGWTFGNGDASTQMNDSATYLAAGTYTVEMVAINSYGCVDTAYATIVVYDPTSVIVPNVFTPNGDGKNDLFEIQSTGLVEMQLDIFDRWGLKMAEITSPGGGWNGKTPGGADAADGTYFFMVKAKGIDGEEVSQQGYLLLAR